MDEVVTIGWSEIGLALGIAFFLEGAIYSLFPGAIHKVMSDLADGPVSALRNIGILSALIGLVIIWFMKG